MAAELDRAAASRHRGAPGAGAGVGRAAAGGRPAAGRRIARQAMKSFLLLAATALLAGCPKKADEPRPATAPVAAKPGDATGSPTGIGPHQDESEHEQLPTKVRLEPGVVRSAGIKTAPAESDSLPATVDLTGEIAADPDRSARLAARVPGRIIDVKAKEGDRV